MKPAIRTISLLVIEDDEPFRLLIRDNLEQDASMRVEAAEASTLRDGLRYLETRPFDVVVLDLNLPDSQNLEALDEVRRAAPQVPAIVLTGSYDPDVAARVMRRGAQDFLPKQSFGHCRLGDPIRHAIERHQIAIELERSRQEQARSDSRCRLILESNTDAVLIVDHEGRVCFANPSAAIMFGRSVADLCGEVFGFPVTRDHVAELDIRRPGGGTGVAEMRVTAVDWDGHPSLLAALRDITERKRDEERIREQAALLDRTSDAIIVCGLDDVIRFWSKGAERVFGWSTAEAVGRSLLDEMFVPRDAFDAAMAPLRRDHPWSGELKASRRDGSAITIEGRYTLLFDRSGRPEAILALNTDITERKRLEEQFFRAQRMESIGTLAGGIAHDLNNVLTPILVAVTSLRESLTDPSQAETLELIESSAQHGAQLVKQVLAFGRGAQGQRIPVNPLQVARNVAKIVKDTFPRAIDFRLKTAPDLWTLTGDPTHLHQVMVNLCVNARDAMPCGGALTLELANAVIDAGMFTPNGEAVDPGNYVCITVSDSGHGIPTAIQERIFEPFFTTKEIGQGTGLGLSTVLAITKSHGGFTVLRSREGEGTVFKVHFPALAAPTATLSETPPAAGTLPRGSGQTILLIDDEHIIRSVSRLTLERFGYKTKLAVNGADGVAIFAQHPGQIDLVITDMNMPVMGGAETIAALRAIDPAIRIIGSSGLPPDVAADALPGHAVDGFIAKPYGTSDLLLTVHRVLNG